MTSRKLRYGLVGAGSIAERKHLKGYLGQPGVEVVAVCNHRPDRAAELARQYGIPKVYADYREMFDEAGLDLISICTPNHTHLPIAVAALEKGIHVHCEKPIALNAGEAERMIAARDRSGKQLMIGLNNRFTGSAYFAKRYIAAGHLGEIYHLRCGWRRRRQIPGKGSWFTAKALAGGGPLIDLGVHYLDLALYLSGFPKAESVSAATYSKFADNRCLNSWTYGDSGVGVMDVEDLAVGLVRLENGATLDLNSAGPPMSSERANFMNCWEPRAAFRFAKAN
jgi:predicted dehydrogenase